MESFFLAETTKYLYLLFDTDNFMHNPGNQGTIIDTPNGQCIIDAGGYIFNTEAHPIDPSALHCCHNVPKMRVSDFKEFRSKRSLFRGETLEESLEVKKNETVEEVKTESTTEVGEGSAEQIDDTTNIEDAVVTTIEPNKSYVKLEDNDNISLKITVNGSQERTENTEIPTFIQQIFPGSVKKFNPQQMLERIRQDKKYIKNDTWQYNYKLLSCKAQPFLQRISIMGEFFN